MLPAEDRRFDVIGIGRAFTDGIVSVDDSFMAAHDLPKGRGTALEADALQALLAALPAPLVLAAGGSVANSMCGVAHLGGRAAYLGRVGSDEAGRYFTGSLEDAGVAPLLAPAPSGISAFCTVLKTPDRDRSFAFNTGVADEIALDAGARTALARTAILLIELQVMKHAGARQAVLEAIAIVRAAKATVAFSIQDQTFLGDEGAMLRSLVQAHADILLGNTQEIAAFNGRPDAADGAPELCDPARLTVITDGASGGTLVTGDARIPYPAVMPAKLVDTNGAGDQFAAGFLLSMARELPLIDCALAGARSAAEIIARLGARPPLPQDSRAAAAVAAG